MWGVRGGGWLWLELWFYTYIHKATTRTFSCSAIFRMQLSCSVVVASGGSVGRSDCNYETTTTRLLDY